MRLAVLQRAVKMDLKQHDTNAVAVNSAVIEHCSKPKSGREESCLGDCKAQCAQLATCGSPWRPERPEIPSHHCTTCAVSSVVCTPVT